MGVIVSLEMRKVFYRKKVPIEMGSYSCFLEENYLNLYYPL